MLGRWGLTEYIKLYPEPVVDFLVDFVVFRTQGDRINTFFQGLCFAGAEEARKRVGGECFQLDC